MSSGPIRVAIVNDTRSWSRGRVHARPHHDRVNVVETDSSLPVISNVDVILPTPSGRSRETAWTSEDLVQGPTPTSSSSLEPAAPAGAAGDRPRRPGYLRSLSAGGSSTGSRGGPQGRDRHATSQEAEDADRGAGSGPAGPPASPHGESEVLALITQGLSNQGDRRAHLPVDQLGQDLTSARRTGRSASPGVPRPSAGDAARLRAGPHAQHRHLADPAVVAPASDVSAPGVRVPQGGGRARTPSSRSGRLARPRRRRCRPRRTSSRPPRRPGRRHGSRGPRQSARPARLRPAERRPVRRPRDRAAHRDRT